MPDINYAVVYNTLKEQISRGDYPVDSLLPAEPELEKIFHVSRTTVRKAVEMLAADGYVKKQRGIGTIILNYEITQNLNTVTSLTETLKKKGYTVTIPEMSIALSAVDPATADILGIAPGEKVAKIHRLVCASGTPLGLVENIIPYSLVEGIEAYTHRFDSLYRFLEKQYFLTIEMARDKIFAKNADATEAAKLQVPEGFALICVKRLCIRHGKSISYDELHLRHDMYGFDISLYSRS